MRNARQLRRRAAVKSLREELDGARDRIRQLEAELHQPLRADGAAGAAEAILDSVSQPGSRRGRWRKRARRVAPESDSDGHTSSSEPEAEVGDVDDVGKPAPKLFDIFDDDIVAPAGAIGHRLELVEQRVAAVENAFGSQASPSVLLDTQSASAEVEPLTSQIGVQTEITTEQVVVVGIPGEAVAFVRNSAQGAYLAWQAIRSHEPGNLDGLVSSGHLWARSIGAVQQVVLQRSSLLALWLVWAAVAGAAGRGRQLEARGTLSSALHAWRARCMRQRRDRHRAAGLSTLALASWAFRARQHYFSVLFFRHWVLLTRLEASPVARIASWHCIQLSRTKLFSMFQGWRSFSRSSGRGVRDFGWYRRMLLSLWAQSVFGWWRNLARSAAWCRRAGGKFSRLSRRDRGLAAAVLGTWHSSAARHVALRQGLDRRRDRVLRAMVGGWRALLLVDVPYPFHFVHHLSLDEISELQEQEDRAFFGTIVSAITKRHQRRKGRQDLRPDVPKPEQRAQPAAGPTGLGSQPHVAFVLQQAVNDVCVTDFDSGIKPRLLALVCDGTAAVVRAGLGGVTFMDDRELSDVISRAFPGGGIQAWTANEYSEAVIAALRCGNIRAAGHCLAALFTLAVQGSSAPPASSSSRLWRVWTSLFAPPPPPLPSAVLSALPSAVGPPRSSPLVPSSPSAGGDIDVDLDEDADCEFISVVQLAMVLRKGPL